MGVSQQYGGSVRLQTASNTREAGHREESRLGSTSHIASAAGALIESYQYDVYGKPRVYDSGGTYQGGATPIAQFLQGGARWMPELGLYDDRNRFMSPDLGRFIQPDPIGFKGDASNLYRYCGNDWANRTDPSGLGENMPNAVNYWNTSAMGHELQNFTNRVYGEMDRWKSDMAAATRAVPGAANVEWKASLQHDHNANQQFGPGVAASTEWKVVSTAKTENGKIVGFTNELQVTVHWNDAKINSPGFQKHWDRFFDRDTQKRGHYVGEITHTLDALAWSRNGSPNAEFNYPHAWGIANDTAKGLIGRTMSAQDAKSRMENALAGWSDRSLRASINKWDHLDWPAIDSPGHLYEEH